MSKIFPRVNMHVIVCWCTNEFKMSLYSVMGLRDHDMEFAQSWRSQYDKSHSFLCAHIGELLILDQQGSR